MVKRRISSCFYNSNSVRFLTTETFYIGLIERKGRTRVGRQSKSGTYESLDLVLSKEFRES